MRESDVLLGELVSIDPFVRYVPLHGTVLMPRPPITRVADGNLGYVKCQSFVNDIDTFILLSGFDPFLPNKPFSLMTLANSQNIM